ncbi:hypothetical protein [Bradyrhizobium sp. BR 10261]|uniref:hypothetical protein n=1 Tax=Bradyrhizobium sp. BR 10261 TaxID=2749992 RepID=UPI001C64DBB8|nr:hypothetical protein [Bradyrhizobium sp. BR 10261]MBW7961581.1 hypothetical protein [Bradyrhizobium sp. BR 10261]
MKNLILIATAIASIAGATSHQANACTLRLPTFEVTGFPISRHQVAVLGAEQVEESSVTPKLTLAGMPASPHQIAVMTPHQKPRIVEASADTSQLTIGLARPSAPKSNGEVCVSD